MKKNKLLGIAAIVALLTTMTQSSRCPAVDPLYHTVLLPNPDDCSSYFMCSNGVPILQKCPEGLHFNARLNVCDWPQNAGCGGSGGFFGDDMYYDLYMDLGGGGGIPVLGSDDPPPGTVTPGTPVIVKSWYDNVFTWMDPKSTSELKNMFAPLSQIDPTRVGECTFFYKKPVTDQRHSCYVTK